MRRILCLSALVPLLAACGGDGAAETDPPPDETTTGGETVEAEAAPEGQPYGPMPTLNVYVQGPDPAPGERYRAEIVVSNTGDAPVELSFSMIDFQLIQDGEHVSCGDESQTDAAPGPDALEPGEAHVYEGRFHCTIEDAGTYELRAYMNFGAEIAPGEDRERYYVGSHEVVVE